MMFSRRRPKPPGDPEELRSWMETGYERGNLKRVWEHCLALGYEFGQDGMTATTWFWLNAYPALAALRCGAQGHPFIAACAGYADQAHWDCGPSEKEVNAEINARFFGQ